MFDSILDATWRPFLDLVGIALTALHDMLSGPFGEEVAWGWAIIALTLIVRTLLLPLAIKQIRSMRGMQAIQPKVKEIQEKYKVDRGLMKKDPERYQKLKQAQNERLMELYKEEGVNPASSCLPLLLQMPVFFALFTVLGDDRVEGLADASFYFFTSFISADATYEGLGATIGQAGWPGWLLIVLMAGTMFLTQRQMQARNTAEGAQATQQKIMMYVFPVFLAAISFGFPLAVVLYWVTTNIWQSVQQYFMLRTAAEEEPPRKGDSGKQSSTPPGAPPATDPSTGKGPDDDGGRSSGRGKSKDTPKDTPKGQDRAEKPKKASPSRGGSHLPRRKQ